MHRKSAVGVSLLALTGVLVAAPAGAHISLERAGTHVSRYGDSEIKGGPCGRAKGARGTHVYTYAPGQTIDVSIVEFVAHPSYFRIAFDDDGDDAFIEPKSIKPIDPKRKCPTGPGDFCGAADFYNSPAVLPGMDNLNPHLAALGTTPKYTWSVKLPDVECTNCTLQIIQVMEDDAFHGPYDPTPGVGIEDVYHQCIDLVLKRGTVDGGLGPVVGSDGGGTAPPSTTTGGGTSTTGGASNAGGGASAGTTPASASADAASESDGGGCTVTRSVAGSGFAWAVLSAGLLLASVRRRTRRTPR